MDDSYDNALHDGRDLVDACRRGRLPAPLFRDADVEAVAGALARNKSVLLLGPTGVGKTSIVHGLAHQFADADRPLVELSTTAMLAGTRYLGEWQSKVTKIVEACKSKRVVLYVPDAYNLPRAARTSQNDTNLFDALRSHIVAGDVRMVAEASPGQLAVMERHPGFLDVFEIVRVEPLPPDRVGQTIERAAEALGLPVDAGTRDAIVQLTSRFLPARPQPGPALSLLAQVEDYAIQKRGIGEDEPLSPAFVEKVFAIYTGLPLFVVSRSATRPAAEIRQWFESRLVGQRAAIEAVVEMIALYKAGLHDPSRPIGTLLFVGPTGVGKTELARALATFLFGSAHRLLRFDLSEFKSYNAFEQLLGTAGDPSRPARLVDPIRTQPFQVVLLDELEKAHQNVWDLLLPLLDEGRLTTPTGDLVDCRNTIVIATSNVGAQAADTGVGFGAASNRDARLKTALEAAFRPELLNRFQHVVIFHPLSTEQLREVARHELRGILAREGITTRNLVVEVDDTALDVVIARGVDRRYGARALKRELQRQIVLPLALTLMERDVEAGQILGVTGRDGHVRIRLLDTPDSREARREREPVKLEGRKLSKADVVDGVRQLRDALEALSRDVGEPMLLDEVDLLRAEREKPEFWQDSEAAARALRDLDRATVIVDRLDRLRSRAEDLVQQVDVADTRRDVEHAGRAWLQLSDAVVHARRELVAMGDAGGWDALVEVRPLGQVGRLARDLLVRVYTKWAASRKMAVEWLRVPMSDDEPALFAIKGRYATGLLLLEAGLHRVRDGEDHGTVRVRVAPWVDRTAPVAFIAHHALKGVGAYGQKVRSRLECQGGLVLQNGRTLAENRDLAVEIGASWAEAAGPVDVVVRRYDLVAPLVRDVLTDSTTGRPDALEPEPFHALLCARVDMASEGPAVA